MIFNMTGGGTSLNFKVVGGTTEPSNPKENTIWVNTDKEITGWYFASKQHEDMKEGEVWLSTGTSSTVEFNALKKNGIQVYPISAKQYTNGAWVDKTAKSYQGGKWVEWVTYLYHLGDEYTDITGGWESNAGDRGRSLGVYTQNSDGTATLGITKSNTEINRGTKSKIDLTKYNKIYVEVVAHSGAPSYVRCGDTMGQSENYEASIDVNAAGVVYLDIQNVSGYYYVWIRKFTAGSAFGETTYGRVWLE